MELTKYKHVRIKDISGRKLLRAGIGNKRPDGVSERRERG